MDLTAAETALVIMAGAVVVGVIGLAERIGGARGALTLYRKGRREALDRGLRAQLGEGAPLPGWSGEGRACWHVRTSSIVARDDSTHPAAVKWNEKCHACGATRGTWAASIDS